MAIINYGTTTKNYIVGLQAELAGLDSKAEGFAEAKKLIESELDGAKKNLAAEQKAAADAEAAELEAQG